MPSPRKSSEPGFTLLGVITGHHGVRGWVRIRSHTRPAEEILQYDPWTLLPGDDRSLSGSADRDRQATDVSGSWRVADSRRQKNGLIVRLDGITSRDEAAPLIGLQIAVPDAEMPPPPDGEYYWADLIGLNVVNQDGERLGVVDHLLETGANDVLVVRQEGEAESTERLIPWGPDVIDGVDLDNRELRVNWGLDY